MDPGSTRREHGMVRIDSLLSGDSPRLSGADEAHVNRLAEAGVQLPPIIVHRPTMRIIDGVHRVRAAMLNGKIEIEAEFFDGSEDEAFVKAVELNIAHGLPLTMTERKLAAARILANCPDLSDRTIARSCGLSDKTVAGIRRSAAEHPQPGIRQSLLRQGLLPERDKPANTTASPSAPYWRTRNASPDPTPGVAIQDISFILEKLKRDPSLRFNDSGREFLRLLQLQCTALGEWPQLAQKLPGHCTDVMVQFARSCAMEWDAAARSLQRRSTFLTTPEPDLTS